VTGTDRSAAENAELALLLEVAATPTPGNVDREREYDDLRFAHFMAGAVGARPGLAAAADGESVGSAFEWAVEGMSRQSGGNTQFGALLLLIPLVCASAADDLSPAGVRSVVAGTTADDAAAFYRAFDHVDISVGPPPGGDEALDVRRGGDAAETLRRRDLTLAAVMGRVAHRDGVAAEWAGGFERTFAAAEALLAADGPVLERAAGTFLDLLAARPDGLLAQQHGEATAEAVRERAARLAAGSPDRETVAAWGETLVERGHNPGTTADILAAGLFVALERGLAV
jgi:triphosphoribosyl-dephospho-CoA synthase